jgi:hypothetical protein
LLKLNGGSIPPRASKIFSDSHKKEMDNPETLKAVELRGDSAGVD